MTNKCSVLYTTAKIHDAKININIMENIDAEGPNAMFGDDDIKSFHLLICPLSCYNSLTRQSCLSPSFDHQLDNIRVDTVQLKQAATHRVFHAWVEEWEEESIFKACCVAEAHILEKYRGLAFYYPDDKVTRTVYSKNLEWVKKTRGMKGSRNRWALLGTHPDMDDDVKSNHLRFQTWLMV